MPADRVVAVSGRLILVSGLGSIVGPLIGTSVMTRFGLDGLFYFVAAAALLLAFLAAAPGLTTAPPEHRERPFDVLAPRHHSRTIRSNSSDEPPSPASVEGASENG